LKLLNSISAQERESYKVVKSLTAHAAVQTQHQ